MRKGCIILKNCLFSCILLALTVLPAVAQTAECTCPTDESKFQDSGYFSSFYPNFKLSCLTDKFYIENEENTAITDILKRLLLVSGSSQQVALSLQQEVNNLLKVLTQLDPATQNDLKQLATRAGAGVRNASTVKIWTAHIACRFAQTAETYYFKYPESAPAKHQSFYKKKEAVPTTNDTSVKMPIDPVMIGILAGVFLGAILVSSLISAANVKRRLARQQLDTETILKDPEFVKWAKEWIAPLNSSLSEQKKLKQSISVQNDKIKEIKDLGEKLNKVMKQSGAVDVDKLQQVLNDLSKRVKELEDLPVRRENLRIVLQPEDFMNFLQKNPDIRETVKEGLDIVFLRDTITKLLPHPLNMKELGELDKETIARYWRIFRQNPEFLPAFKEELKQEWKAR